MWQIRWGNNESTVSPVSQVPYLQTQGSIAWSQIGVQLKISSFFSIRSFCSWEKFLEIQVVKVQGFYFIFMDQFTYTFTKQQGGTNSLSTCFQSCLTWIRLYTQALEILVLKCFYFLTNLVHNTQQNSPAISLIFTDKMMPTRCITSNFVVMLCIS